MWREWIVSNRIEYFEPWWRLISHLFGRIPCHFIITCSALALLKHLFLVSIMVSNRRSWSWSPVCGRPFVKRLALCYRADVLSLLAVCSVCLWRWCIVDNGWMDQGETWRCGRPRPYCVRSFRWVPSSAPQKGTTPNLPLGMEVGLGPDDVVLDGDPAPPRKWA